MTFLPSSDFLLKVQLGKVSGMSTILKYGRNPAIGGSAEIIHDLGVAPETYIGTNLPAAAGATTLSYTDTGGAGVSDEDKIITVQGLDANWDAQQEDITLTAGGSPITLANSYLRVNRMFVKGSNGEYSNNAAITAIIGGQNQCRIPAGFGQTVTAFYTVPAGKTAYIISTTFSIDSSQEGDVSVYSKTAADTEGGARVRLTYDGISAPFLDQLDYLVSVPEKTDIWAQGTSGGAPTTIMSAQLAMLLVDNATYGLS